jgi:holo-[acyl-carrier protein] synthase
MIYGIGIDIIKIDRMRSAVERWGRRFLEKVFTEQEIRYCYERSDPYPSLAVRFAVKEALIKAIGSRVFIPLTDIEVVNSMDGAPIIRAHGKLKYFLMEKSISHCHISISHERDFGIAFVVLER